MEKKLSQSSTLTGKTETLLQTFQKNGVVECPGLVPHAVIDDYVNNFWHKTFTFDDNHQRFTGIDQMYLEYPEIRDLLLHQSISDTFTKLDMCLALHSDLTYWRSSNTGWHVDELNDNPNGADQYLGVWIALADIDEGSGPFQYLKGSHRWDLDISFGKDNRLGMLHMCQMAMDNNEHEVTTFMPKKGDALFWNSRVIHRGSPPRRNIPRPALIGHFSNHWTWSESTERPQLSEVVESMERDPDMRWHGSGWYRANMHNSGE
jgi:ectoine hydroxylase-related dioxygenase (phytanoyl-CoA dioxygenase family)